MLVFFARDMPAQTLETFTLYNTITTFKKDLKVNPFENMMGKGENAGNQYFLLFPQCFLPFPKQMLFFKSGLLCRL